MWGGRPRPPGRAPHLRGQVSQQKSEFPAHEFARTHLPQWFRLAIALVELLGAILFLIPPTVLAGGRLLLATFGVAAVVHLLHGQPDIGYLVIYAMAVLTIITGRA